ncbi:MAG: DUF1080 domain-containing protein [Planctomycetaceae bacterium]|nr:DUF1080 domain-containing protein [Planctomycetaceae bacterium]
MMCSRVRTGIARTGIVRSVLLSLQCLCLVGLSQVSLAQEGEFESIFDGKTMNGWEGAKDYWSVEDGALTGQFTADNNLPNNTFLIWRGGKVSDFHLKLKFRMTEGNSGIQYRSQEHDNYVVGGYQADADFGKQWVGILYDERGRGILATRMQSVTIQANGEKVVEELDADAKAFLEKYNPSEWNTYEIIAQGNRLEHIVNGVTTVKVVDQQTEASEAEGILAFQLHTGPPMKVQFKDVQIKSLAK